MTHESIKDVNLSAGFDEVLFYSNRVTESWLSRSILIGVFIIVTFGVYKFRSDLLEALSIGGFSTFLMAFFFWTAGFVDTLSLVIAIVVSIVSFGFLWFSKKSP